MLVPNKTLSQILQDEWNARRKDRPGYSLRSFAQDLGIPASRLSEALSGKRNLSHALASKIADTLEYSPEDRELLLALADSRSGSASLRKYARLTLARRRARSPQSFRVLTESAFEPISNWYHNALLELVTLPGFEPTHEFIAERLGIQTQQAMAAVESLLARGLLERKDGTLKPTTSLTTTTQDISVPSIRKHHLQALGKAAEALTNQPVEEREFATLVFAFDSTQMAEVKKMLREFRRELGIFLSQSESQDRVYALSMQFFGLDRLPVRPVPSAGEESA